MATKCDLVMWSDAVPITIARGLVIPNQPVVHNAPVEDGYVCVQVDSVEQKWKEVALPVPTQEMFVLDDTRESFIQWPKNQIILDKVMSKLSISLVTLKTDLFKYLRIRF